MVHYKVKLKYKRKKEFKIKLIQIPNSLIRDPKITAVDFVLLFKLKHLMFLYDSNIFEVDNNKLKYSLGIADNKTIKKSYINLYDQGYLLEPVEIKRSKPVRFAVNTEKVIAKEEVVELPYTLIQYLDKIGYVGVRLLYCYSIDNTMTIETIKTHLNIHKDTIQEHNKKLLNLDLISISRNKDSQDTRIPGVEDKLEYKIRSNSYSVHMDKLLLIEEELI